MNKSALPKNRANRKTGMARLWELAFRRKLLVITSCVLAVLSVMMAVTPFVVVYFIIAQIVENYADLARLDSSYLIQLGWLAAAGAVATILLNWAALICSHIAAFSTIHDLRLEFIEHVASLPLGFHTQNATGKLRKIIDENIEKLEGFIAHQLPDLAGSLAMPLVVLTVLLAFDWRFGLASLIPIAIAYLIQRLAYGNRYATVFLAKYQKSLEDMNNAAVEYVRGISVVKAFNQTIYSFRRFHDIIVDYGRFIADYLMAYRRYIVMFALAVYHAYLVLIPTIILLYGGVDDYPRFALSAVFYLLFSVSIPTPFMRLLNVSQAGRQIADGIVRMDDILERKPLPDAAVFSVPANYTITFDNVSFSYEEERGGEKREALAAVNFRASQGQITALVGPSGSGKSTIAHLICRFYDVSAGAIRIGGVDLRDISATDLLSLVSFVFQNVFLFKQSIEQNIRVGRQSATRAEVIGAARAAQCHDFIEALPQGYDTVIGAAGIHLSGGERQRIAIARALLKDAPILVLDEATAFADPENEQRIQLALERLMRGKTVIVIAHRLSAVRGADQIVVIEKGRVVERGTHDVLLAGKGFYRQMWEQSTSAMSWSLARDQKAGKQ